MPEVSISDCPGLLDVGRSSREVMELAREELIGPQERQSRPAATTVITFPTWFTSA